MISQESSVDELFAVKNNFYIGNYVQCIKEADKIKVHKNDQDIIRKSFLYRAYISQKKYRVVLEELSSSTVPELEVISYLARYFSTDIKDRKIIVDELEEKIKNKDESFNNVIGAKVVATVFMNEKQWETALISVINFLHSDLELMSFAVLIYLKMDRFDLAQKQFREMQSKDDDATLTQLAQAWVHVYNGNEKLQEASYIYQELIEKFGATSLLLNARAAIYISQGNYKAAEDDLNEALDKDDTNPDTLMNFIIVSKYLKKSEEILTRYLMQLKDLHFSYPILCDYRQKEIEFTSLSSYYKPSKDISALSIIE